MKVIDYLAEELKKSEPVVDYLAEELKREQQKQQSTNLKALGKAACAGPVANSPPPHFLETR
jgi:hypothetical protein